MSERLTASGERPGATAIDPICGMTVSTDSPLRSTRDGETFYFCSTPCKAKFDANGERRAANDEHRTANREPRTANAEYTCPMHPEVVRDGPGACPICGMALEPRVVTLDDKPNPELIDMRRRFVVS